MNELFRYLLLSSVSLALLYMVYAMLLRREPFFRFNRLYLVLIVLFSLLFPLMPSGLSSPLLPRGFAITLDPVYITPGTASGSTPFRWEEALFYLYITGVLLLGIRLLFRLLQLVVLVGRHGIIRQYNSRVVQLPGHIAPFSFFNLIFLSRKASEDDKLHTILLHETIHIRQYHTLDILLMECLSILLWFNPVVWLLRRSIKSLHEYLADDGVITSGMESNRYQQMILDQTIGLQLNTLTNQFNVSLLKNRITMMSKQSSSRMAWSKALLAIPTTLFVVIFLLAASHKPLNAQDQSALKDQQQKEQQLKMKQQKEYQAQSASKNDDPVFQKVDKAPEYPGGVEQLYAFIGQNIHYPKEAVEKKITGTVYVSFIIEKDGSVSNAEIKKGIGAGCDEEALRVIKLMPKWKAGMNNDKVVRVAYTLPIKFKMQ